MPGAARLPLSGCLTPEKASGASPGSRRYFDRSGCGTPEGRWPRRLGAVTPCSVDDRVHDYRPAARLRRPARP